MIDAPKISYAVALQLLTIKYSPDRIDDLSPSSNDTASFRSGHNCPQGDRHLWLVLLHVGHPGQNSLNSEKHEKQH